MSSAVLARGQPSENALEQPRQRGEQARHQLLGGATARDGREAARIRPQVVEPQVQLGGVVPAAAWNENVSGKTLW